MRDCACASAHPKRRVVLTGGPGAGKTAVLELVRQYFCRHVLVLPESAGILFGGGFPRGTSALESAASQRAIYHVQRQLEAWATAHDGTAIVLCDRGTVDGAAYWPGPDTLWSAIGVTREEELLRYDAVIHLRTPDGVAYNHSNPLRIESAAEAAAIDERIVDAWAGHPRRFFIESTGNFLDKAHRALALLRAELPECCRGRAQPAELTVATTAPARDSNP
jgi:predicted ATPase